ncbi:MAG: hypothetical protein M1819_001621 [Sarea resinae]|nr:MAG: hypothetical protein M1819_001621 [Sarea resinae]
MASPDPKRGRFGSGSGGPGQRGGRGNPRPSSNFVQGSPQEDPFMEGGSPEVARLRRELAAEREARIRAEQYQQRAEQSRQQAEQSQQRAEQSQQQLQLQLQESTFEEYLTKCHKILSSRMQIQTNLSRATQGSITTAKNKWCPNYLRPWEEFPLIQQRLFDEVDAVLSPETGTAPRMFMSAAGLDGLSKICLQRKIGSEKDLESYVRFAVESHVSLIIAACRARQVPGFFGDITFENHDNTLNPEATDVNDRLAKVQKKKPNRDRAPHADQIAVWIGEDNEARLLLIVEYKAPHKLTNKTLRAVLQNGTRNLNIREQILDNPEGFETTDAKLQYNADKLVATAIAQTYSYMIESGLEYGYVCTGEAYVFLMIDWKSPDTVHYHLAEPNEEVKQIETVSGVFIMRTAIAQVLSFAQMASRADIHEQNERRYVMQGLSTFTVDYEEVLRRIPEDELATSPSSAYKPRNQTKYATTGTSPCIARDRKRRRASDYGRNSCAPMTGNPSNNDDQFRPPPGPPRQGPKGSQPPAPPSYSNPSQGSRSADPKSYSGKGKGKQQYSYCTQKCLLGIERGLPLDPSCPNFSEHQKDECADKHSLDIKTFLNLVLKQLDEDMDNNIKPLGLQGSRGALFKVTLISHGYTFVGKGTIDVFIPDLRHEGQIYQILSHLQGEAIPVYLGNIDLNWPYFLAIRVRIVHMLFMSYAGEMIDQIGKDEDPPFLKVQEETKRSIRDLKNAGIFQNDLRDPNLLWNAERQRVMVIDFDRAKIMKPPSPLSKSVALLDNANRLSSSPPDSPPDRSLPMHSGSPPSRHGSLSGRSSPVHSGSAPSRSSSPPSRPGSPVLLPSPFRAGSSPARPSSPLGPASPNACPRSPSPKSGTKRKHADVAMNDIDQASSPTRTAKVDYKSSPLGMTRPLSSPEEAACEDTDGQNMVEGH